ncbi:hypothetical protein ACVXHB_02585 [Escherichia coli]
MRLIDESVDAQESYKVPYAYTWRKVMARQCLAVKPLRTGIHAHHAGCQ